VHSLPQRAWGAFGDRQRPNRARRYHTPMPENAKTHAYACECGKKWTIPKADLLKDQTWECKCGRTIVVRAGAVFGTRKK
jgi:hypothetical protein